MRHAAPAVGRLSVVVTAQSADRVSLGAVLFIGLAVVACARAASVDADKEALAGHVARLQSRNSELETELKLRTIEDVAQSFEHATPLSRLKKAELRRFMDVAGWSEDDVQAAEAMIVEQRRLFSSWSEEAPSSRAGDGTGDPLDEDGALVRIRRTARLAAERIRANDFDGARDAVRTWGVNDR